jgi:hypothetical protein
VTSWHDEQIERDVAGAATASASGAHIVADLIDLATIYDWRCRRVVEAASDLPDVLAVDLSAYDDGGGVLGPHIVVMDQAIVGAPLARIVSVAEATGESLMRIATWVVGLPCNPCAGCIGRMATDLSAAAKRRRALTVLRDVEHQLLEHPDIADAILPLMGAFR